MSLLALEVPRKDLQIWICGNHGLISPDMETLFLFLCVCQRKVKLLTEQRLRLLEGNGRIFEITQSKGQISLA